MTTDGLLVLGRWLRDRARLSPERIAVIESGQAVAMDQGEITPAGPEIIAWALMAVGEMIGMRWIVWAGTSAAPTHVLEGTVGFISRALGPLPGPSHG